MHKYFIEIYENKEGYNAPKPRPMVTLTADNEIQLRSIRDKYAYEYQTKAKEDGTVEEINKLRYTVVAYKLGYNKLASIDEEVNKIFTV